MGQVHKMYNVLYTPHNKYREVWNGKVQTQVKISEQFLHFVKQQRIARPVPFMLTAFMIIPPSKMIQPSESEAK